MVTFIEILLVVGIALLVMNLITLHHRQSCVTEATEDLLALLPLTYIPIFVVAARVIESTSPPIRRALTARSMGWNKEVKSAFEQQESMGLAIAMHSEKSRPKPNST